MMKRYACCLFLILHLFLVHGDDSKTMLSLSNSLNTKIWNTTNKNPCTWRGVKCSNSSSSHVFVTNLNLSNLNLRTSTTNTSSSLAFFRLLCKLTSLEYLDLSRNSFAFVPSSFLSNCSGLSQLKSLNFSSNLLSGNLSDLSSFRSLEILDLSFNSLQGEVGSQLGRLSGLKSLNLSANSLTGTIPFKMGLEELVLSDNQFSGKLPNEIFQLKNLIWLDLSMNELVGPIPDENFQLKKLTLLNLGSNILTGPIPVEFGELPKLKFLILSSNNLTGKIPSSISSIKTLKLFAANLNHFTGSIPAGITRYLNRLELSYNHLSGRIPSDFLSFPQLEFVDLSNNALEGTIPGNFSQKLFRLRLGGNRLNGRVPSSFQQPSNLTYLELERNNLGGGIPAELKKCLNLTLLNLASNGLQGELPKELGNLHKLVILNLQENRLSGEIPVEFSAFANLSTLNLSHNALSGQIPSEISRLSQLEFLHLEDNKLNGSIPSTINNLRYLIELQLGNNHMNGSIPRMPSALSSLNLSSNLFTGPIPSYLGDLTQLEILDLSKNNFLGEIPYSLTKMPSLTLLVLSYNQLDGTLPHFPRFVDVITTGNRFDTKPASSPPTSKKKSAHIRIIVVSVVCGIIGLVLIFAVLLFVISKRYRVEDEGLRLEEIPPQIINGCFLTSDSNHKANIDFAKAMEVVSKPSNIMLKTRFSTYYKAVMPSGTSYSVKKLNWSDKIFQAGSNERFAEELQVLGMLSNSNVMVPLAYVLTSDSAYLFYEHVQKGTIYDFLHKGSENALDWKSRYSIALGVGQGLTFLHGCIQPVLLLDLSTKSIHLKSMKEPQIGDIELCKVIDPSKSTGNLSTVAGSVGYIPPEYAYTMRVTAPGNVYSFGVILLELLTGKPAVSDGIELAKWAVSSSARLEQRVQILDSRVSKVSPGVQSQMLSVLKVALSCVSVSPEARPKMRNVLRMLFNAR